MEHYTTRVLKQFEDLSESQQVVPKYCIFTSEEYSKERLIVRVVMYVV